jgi:hypothetical protein
LLIYKVLNLRDAEALSTAGILIGQAPLHGSEWSQVFNEASWRRRLVEAVAGMDFSVA